MKKLSLALAAVLLLCVLAACGENISLTVENLTLDVGQEAEISASVTGNSKNEPVTYSFSGDNIAIKDGKVTALKENSVTTVTAACGKATAKFTVTVRHQDIGTLSVSVPKNKELEQDGVLYTNFDARPLVATFSNPAMEEPVTYTVDPAFAGKVFIEDGMIWAEGKFKEAADVTVTASTSRHYVTFTVRVQRLIGQGNGNDLNLEDSIERLEKTWQDRGGQTGGLLWIGDSYFDTRWFFTNFYEKYDGQNAYCVGISSTTTMHWELLVERLVYTVQPKVIAVHVGSNNIHDLGQSADQVAQNVQKLLSDIHENLPDTHIIYYGIEPRLYQLSKNEIAADATAQIQQFCQQNPAWLTYVDAPAWFMKEDGTINVGAFRPNDHAHPALALYDKYIAAAAEVLERLGIEI